MPILIKTIIGLSSKEQMERNNAFKARLYRALDSVKDDLEGAFLFVDTISATALRSTVGLSELFSHFKIRSVFPLDCCGTDFEAEIQTAAGRSRASCNTKPSRPSSSLPTEAGGTRGGAKSVFFVTDLALEDHVASAIARGIQQRSIFIGYLFAKCACQAGSLIAVIVLCGGSEFDISRTSSTRSYPSYTNSVGEGLRQKGGGGDGRSSAVDRTGGGGGGGGHDGGNEFKIENGAAARGASSKQQQNQHSPITSSLPERVMRELELLQQQREKRQRSVGKVAIRTAEVALPISIVQAARNFFTVPTARNAVPLVFTDITAEETPNKAPSSPSSPSFPINITYLSSEAPAASSPPSSSSSSTQHNAAAVKKASSEPTARETITRKPVSLLRFVKSLDAKLGDDITMQKRNDLQKLAAELSCFLSSCFPTMEPTSQQQEQQQLHQLPRIFATGLFYYHVPAFVKGGSPPEGCGEFFRAAWSKLPARTDKSGINNSSSNKEGHEAAAETFTSRVLMGALLDAWKAEMGLRHTESAAGDAEAHFARAMGQLMLSLVWSSFSQNFQ
eukprot:jgi/Bigna1/78648/fgenesh1_pg.56_\